MSKIAVFLDKDGTLIDNVPYNVEPGLIQLSDGSGSALHQLAGIGCELVVVSNQSGVARGYFHEQDLRGVEDRLRDLVRQKAGVDLAGFYFCPHHPNGSVPRYAINCTCRKPQPGMLLQAARDLGIDLERSWMVGDILDDIEAGRRAGCRTILINNGNETEWVLSPERQPHFIVSNLEEAARTIISVLHYQDANVFAILVE